MEEKAKSVLKLHEITDVNYATILKARESWSMFSIMSEFVESTERLSEIGPAVAIFGSARVHPDSPYYGQCMELAKRLSDSGFAVISGGGPGIMAAANRGAFEGKSLSVGLNIELPHEQVPNRWQDVSLNYRHFFARKVGLVKYTDAFIVFPGGYGTLDEMSEVLTLIQTRKSRRVPIILVGSKFWKGFIDWSKDTLLAEGMINREDIELMQIIDDTDKIIEAIFLFYEKRSTGPSEAERQKMLYL